METVDHQIHNPKEEHGPHNTQENLALMSFYVQIRNDVTHPCKHCRKHEQKIHQTINIQEGKEGIYLVMIVQKSPSYVRNEVKACCYKKLAVAYNCMLFRVLISGAELKMPKSLMVQYEIKYQCKYPYY